MVRGASAAGEAGGGGRYAAAVGRRSAGQARHDGVWEDRQGRLGGSGCKLDCKRSGASPSHRTHLSRTHVAPETTRDVGGNRTSCYPCGRLSLAVRGVSHETPLVGRTRHSTTGRRRGLAAGKVRLNFLFARNR